MAILAYPYSVRNSSATSGDNRIAGLAPTISDGKTLAASPATVTAVGNVSVVDVGAGDYVALYDAEAHGDASFPIDWGATLTNPNDRYGTLILTRDAGRIINHLNNAEAGIPLYLAVQAMLAALAGQLSGAGTGTVTIKNPGGTITRLTATTDALGNRSVIVLNLA